MNPEIVVVDYKNPNHANDLVRLLDGYAADPMGGGQALPVEVKANLADSLASIPHAFSLLCYVGDKAAGLTNCFWGFSTFKNKPLINIHDVYVDPAFRGMRLSVLLLEKVKQLASTKGCCKLTLEVLEGNRPARKAYEKFGFAGYELDPKLGQALFLEMPLS